MFCSKCGQKISDDSTFCFKCGSSVKGGKSDDIKTIRLKCQECNGTMDVDESKHVLSCPYCGSKKLLVDSDEVKIEQIRSNERVDIEIGRQQVNRDVEIAKDKHKTELKKESRSFLQELACVILLIIIVAGMWLFL